MHRCQIPERTMDCGRAGTAGWPHTRAREALRNESMADTACAPSSQAGTDSPQKRGPSQTEFVVKKMGLERTSKLADLVKEKQPSLVILRYA
jgi:hypothetical protein